MTRLKNYKDIPPEIFDFFGIDSSQCIESVKIEIKNPGAIIVNVVYGVSTDDEELVKE